MLVALLYVLVTLSTCYEVLELMTDNKSLKQPVISLLSWTTFASSHQPGVDNELRTCCAKASCSQFARKALLINYDNHCFHADLH